MIHFLNAFLLIQCMYMFVCLGVSQWKSAYSVEFLGIRPGMNIEDLL